MASNAGRTSRIAANGLEFETLSAGNPEAPLLLFLHGFPEYAGAWADLLPQFAGTYHAVAPSQRGYASSSKPAGLEHYKAPLLAKDMLELAQQLSPNRPFHLVAHDWGASVGYMMAFMAAPRIKSFTVLNGVHPIPFQRALINDPEQREASQYMRFLRREDSAALLSANNFERVLEFLTHGFGGGRWMTDTKRAGYLAAWGNPGAMDAMVSWYKATPLVVPLPGETVADDILKRFDPAMMRVRMPHQVIWGMQDKALRPVTRHGLAELCDSLVTHDVADADHWIVHQKPDEVRALIAEFIAKHPI